MLHFPSQPLLTPPTPTFNSENSPIYLPSCDVITLISREVSSAPDLQCRGQNMRERICEACLACSVLHQYACPFNNTENMVLEKILSYKNIRILILIWTKI